MDCVRDIEIKRNVADNKDMAAGFHMDDEWADWSRRNV